MTEKEITNMDLAVKIDGLSTVVKSLVGRADGVDRKLDSLDSKVNSLDGKVDGLAATVEDLAAMTERGFAEVHTRIDNETGELREEMHSGFTLLRKDMEAGFESVGLRVDKLESNLGLTKEVIKDHEVRIAGLERKKT